MSSVSQGQMTEKGKNEMFAAWESAAPKNPKNGGWFGSLRSCADEDGQYYACHIEDYNDDGAIVQVGGAQVRLPGMEYIEYYPA